MSLDTNSRIVAKELWQKGTGFDDLLTLICGDDFYKTHGLDVLILCEMFVHNIIQNKMFIPYVFIMFPYEMYSSCSTSEARLITKKSRLFVELSVFLRYLTKMCLIA